MCLGGLEDKEQAKYLLSFRFEGCWSKRVPKREAVVGADSRGFDGGKLVKVCKRYVMVNALGLLLAVLLHQLVLHQVPQRLIRLARAPSGIWPVASRGGSHKAIVGSVALANEGDNGMVDTVVQIIAQMAGGTATAVGTGVGQAVSNVVRERLGRSEDGRSAIRAVDEQPADPVAGAALRALLQAEIDADPKFAQAVAVALAGAAPAEFPHSATGSITLHGSTVRGRNTISLGPVTINNTGTARFTLLAVALVFFGLIAAGIYGGTQLFGGGSTSARPMSALSDGATRRVLPDLSALPAGWTKSDGPAAREASQMSKDAGITHSEWVEFLMGSERGKLSISVVAFASEDKSAAFYRGSAERELATGENPLVSMPRIGDEVFAYSYPPGNGKEGSLQMMMRVGTVIVLIEGDSVEGQPFESSRLEVLAKMMAERAQQAQGGQEPVATARNA